MFTAARDTPARVPDAARPGYALFRGRKERHARLLRRRFAVAQVSQCPYCIDSYTQTALQQGLTMKHLAEAMHAAASLRAGIALAHGLVAHNVDKKISM